MHPDLRVHHTLNEERRQQLLQESARQRVLAGLPRHPGLGRRAVGRLGLALIALGTRLERFEQAQRPALSSIER